VVTAVAAATSYLWQPSKLSLAMAQIGSSKFLTEQSPNYFAGLLPVSLEFFFKEHQYTGGLVLSDSNLGNYFDSVVQIRDHSI